MRISKKRLGAAVGLGLAGLVAAVLGGPVSAQQEQSPRLALYTHAYLVANLIDFRIPGNTKVAAMLFYHQRIGGEDGYLSADLAKAAAIKAKGAEAIIRTGSGKGTRYYAFTVKAVKPTPANLALLTAGNFQSLTHDPSVALDYATLKCGTSLELYRPDAELDKGIVAENVVSDAGLYLTGYEFQKSASSGETPLIELTVFRELLKNNIEEVRAAYACFDARVKAKDPKATPAMRQSFLSSMWANYQRGPQFHAFVEKEMKKYKYTKEQKATVTG